MATPPLACFPQPTTTLCGRRTAGGAALAEAPGDIAGHKPALQQAASADYFTLPPVVHGVADGFLRVGRHLDSKLHRLAVGLLERF